MPGCPPVVINAWHRDRKPPFKRGLMARDQFNPDLGSIGYHYVIDLDGRVWTGRHLDEIGAHALGWNANSVGICLVGGIEREARYTLLQWDALRELVAALQFRLGSGLRIVGHRDTSPDADRDGKVTSNEWVKTCPGFDVGAWLRSGMQPRAEWTCKEAA